MGGDSWSFLYVILSSPVLSAYASHESSVFRMLRTYLSALSRQSLWLVGGGGGGSGGMVRVWRDNEHVEHSLQNITGATYKVSTIVTYMFYKYMS